MAANGAGSRRGFMAKLKDAVVRIKHVDKDDMSTPLNRCLTTFDLTVIGVGSMTGAGIYVLTGVVAKTKTGPLTFLSYLLAAFVAFLNALAYAELACIIPKAGSAYSYTYVAAGELAAFIIGWSIILEYVLSVASVARGFSGTLNSMTGGAIRNGSLTYLNGVFPKGTHWMSEYPDLIAFGIVMILCFVVMAGPKVSARFTTVITAINVMMVLVTSFFMYITSDPSSFSDEKHGGILPYGMGGIIAGASTCFYAFIGFDMITISAEEAEEPKKSVPRANLFALSTVTSLLMMASIAIVVFVPWWSLDMQAPFPEALRSRGFIGMSYFTAVGSLIGITASCFMAIYGLPRIVYAMAQDGLIFRGLAYVYPKTQVPIIGLLIFSFLAAILALLFDIDVLADFLSIGTLIAYTIVSAVVVVLRFKGDSSRDTRKLTSQPEIDDEDDYSEDHDEIGTLREPFRTIPMLSFLKRAPSKMVPLISLVVFIVLALATCFLVLFGITHLLQGTWWTILILVIFIIGLISCILLMSIYNQKKNFETFQVPLVPLLPCVAIFLNFTLIAKLSWHTWLRFIIWLILGLIIYFAYGIRNSNLATSPKDDDSDSIQGEKMQEDLPLSKTSAHGYQALDDKDIKKGE